MGKKSRLKRRIYGQKNAGIKGGLPVKETGISNALLFVIRAGIYLTLVTPLITSTEIFFPFVAAKGLFFMALAEIMVFSWLGLMIISKKYRPRFSLLSISLLIMLAIFCLFLKGVKVF